jgi:hypothetical protein
VDDRTIIRADGGALIRSFLAERQSWHLQADVPLVTERWLQRLDPAFSFVVQIGANDHSQEKGTDFNDPARLAVGLGWRASLIEPVPAIHSRLRERYSRPGSNVEVLQGAVCRSCREESAKMWAVDLNSNRLSRGSNHSDPRCAQVRGVEYVTQIASLSRAHVLASDRNLAWGRHRCDLCSRIVGRPLPGDCLRRLVRDHLVSMVVPCLCLGKLLPRLLADPTAHRQAVSLLVVDAESYDLHVLRQYPFETVPTWRVVYETVHLSNDDIVAAARLMRSQGFVSLLAPLSKSPFSVWHNNKSAEVWRSRTGPAYRMHRKSANHAASTARM